MRSVAGVKKVEVSFDKKEAYVLADAAKADPQPMIAAIKKAGYEASFKRAGGPDGK